MNDFFNKKLDDYGKIKREDFKRMWMNISKITGHMERNMGTIKIEVITSRTFFEQFFEALYGKDHPEGAEMPMGEWKVLLSQEKLELVDNTDK